MKDLVQGIFKLVRALQLPEPVRAFLIARMADLDYDLAMAVTEQVQLGALVAVFTQARHMLA